MKKLCLLSLLFIYHNLLWSQVEPSRKGTMSKPFIFSQQFKHAVGIGSAFYKVNESREPVYMISYSPTLSLTKSFSDFSVSVGSQLSGGYHFANSADDSSFLFADLPILVEMNLGHNASKDFYSDLGWFFGGGYSFNLFKERWQQGPVVSIGARAFILGPSFTLRLMRFFAIREEDVSLYSVTLSLNLGRYFEQVKLNNKVSRFSNGFRKNR
jgi:hypothetical protein